MFQIPKPTSNFQLLHWTKKLFRASDADSLGLKLRVSTRLSNEILCRLTTVTPSARYYVFFRWALHDYNDHEPLTTAVEMLDSPLQVTRAVQARGDE